MITLLNDYSNPPPIKFENHRFRGAARRGLVLGLDFLSGDGFWPTARHTFYKLHFRLFL